MFDIIITTILCESFHAVGQERFSGIVRFQCEMCFSFCKIIFCPLVGRYHSKTVLPFSADSIVSTKKVGSVNALF